MSEPPFTSQIDLETPKGCLRVDIWEKEIPQTSLSLINACISGELAGKSFEKVTDDEVCLSCRVPYEHEHHSRIRAGKRGTVIVNSEGKLIFTRLANVQSSGTIVGRLTSDALNVLESIAQRDREGTRPIYPLSVLPRNPSNTGGDNPTKAVPRPKRRQVQLFDDDGDETNESESKRRPKRPRSKLLTSLLKFERRLSYTKW